MSAQPGFAFSAAVLSVAAFAAFLASSPVLAQSPVVQPQYFGAPVSPVVAVDLSGASSQPLGQSAFAGGQVGGASAGAPTYGQRVQAELSAPMYTGVSGIHGSAGPGRALRP
jgi:hypothetical protein